MKKSTFLILFFLIVFSNSTYAENDPQKYVQISNSQQTEYEKIVIYEFFWYGCPHCFNIEPTIEKIESNLEKDTILIKLPLALRESWMNHAKAFFSMQQM